MTDIHAILKEYWGYGAFRPLQEEIIQHVLAGNDTLALLPTGGGKSICFQVPAMARPGLCLVISPLIALMKDQVENLRKKNITAFAVFSGMTRKEVINTLSIAGNSNCKFLYVSPERLETGLFKEFLPGLNVNLIAVDEAHCISQWGYDFRPPYLRIADLRKELPDIPVLALTASATPEVQEDICTRLNFTGRKIFRQSFARPNLSYSAFAATSKINRIVEILQKVEGTGIVYCRTRKRTREIAELLQMQGISADYYHAGLTQEQRNAKQEAWIKNQTRIIACTNAFGMGIDKPDVRIVIHADVPDCLENYYQEAGRAGRDGKKSYAVLLHTAQELEELLQSTDTKFPSLAAIQKIYNDLMNHLQVPAGGGAELYFDFDFPSFVKQFSLDAQQAFAVLKTLEQEELLYFNEQVFLPSTVQVTASRELLNEFEAGHPQVDALLKTLLRAYEGIVDIPVRINEKWIARRINREEQEVINMLHQLHGMAVIEYVPQKDRPQIYLLQNRIKSTDLRINTEDYLKRKTRYERRAHKMVGYAQATRCRAAIIGNYFGDQDLQDCGICDVCLAKKRKEMNIEEVEQIFTAIATRKDVKGISLDELLTHLGGISRSRVMEAIRFLQSEQRITVSDKGEIRTT